MLKEDSRELPVRIRAPGGPGTAPTGDKGPGGRMGR